MKRTIYDEDHEAFRSSVKRVPRPRGRPAPRGARSRARRSRATSGIEAGKQGFLGLEIPEEYGGSEAGDYRFNAVLTEELAQGQRWRCRRASASTPTSSRRTSSHLTTEEQKQRWLPGFCCRRDPHRDRHDRAVRRLRPRRPEDHRRPRRRRLDPQRLQDLHHQRLLRRPGDRRGPHRPGEEGQGASRCSASRRRSPGFSRGRKLDKVGQDESDTAELFFEDVRVSDDDIDRRARHGLHPHDAAPAAGAARLRRSPTSRTPRRSSTRRSQYAKDRKAFGQPIGTFQHNKFLLAELVTRVEVTQAYVDQCVVAHTEGELTAVDAAKAKWWTAQVQNDVLDHCVQLHGGYGYMNEYRVARAWRDARVTKIWAGSNEIMKELIGRDLGL